MDTVAQCLSDIKKQLDEGNLPYVVSITRPTRTLTNVDEECLYVIRQQVDKEGIYHLLAAAKMGAEKC